MLSPLPIGYLKRLITAITGSAAVIVLSACESNQNTNNQQTLPTPTQSSQWVSQPTAEGLDIRWLVIEGGHSLAPSLALLENFDVPADQQTLALWKSVGLRVHAIPAQHIQLITERTGRPRAREQRWLPSPNTWHELTRGPAYPQGLILALDEGRIRMPPGRPRLLVRAWTRPVADTADGPRTAMRLELVPQHETRSNRDDGSLTPSPTLTLLDAESQGMVFRRFTLSIEAEPGMAYVVYAESPQVDWSALATGEPQLSGISWFERLPEPVDEEQEQEPDDETTPAGDAGPFDTTTDDSTIGPAFGVFTSADNNLNEIGHNQPDNQPPLGPRRGRNPTESSSLNQAGPTAPKAPYLGEALLTQRSPSTTRDGARIILIIIPAFDPAYRLIGD